MNKLTDFTINFNKEDINLNIDEDCFGLEREGLRTTLDGNLARTKHPFRDAHIDRDFCENQIEIITDVYHGASNALKGLEELTDSVNRTLYHMPDGREVFWPFSNPPYVEDEDSIDIAEFSADNQDKRDYREYLAGKYGKRLMLYSGIHFNYSLRDETLAEACRGTGMEFREFKNNVYLNLAKRLTKLGWFIVYLLAASPVIDESFLKKSGKGISTVTTYASPRCSEKGYWNDFTPILDYSTLEGYAASIEAYVESGDLIAPRELYYPVRVKPAGANSLDNLKEKGVNHIEIRVVDLNPFAKAGIFEEDIKLLHVLILYLLSLGETSFTPEEQEEAMTRMKEAAKLDGGSFGSRNETEALDLLSTIEEFYKGLGEPYGPELIAYQRAKVTDRSKSYPAMVIEAFGENYLEEGLKLAGEYQEDSMVESDDGDKSQVI